MSTTRAKEMKIVNVMANALGTLYFSKKEQTGKIRIAKIAANIKGTITFLSIQRMNTMITAIKRFEAKVIEVDFFWVAMNKRSVYQKYLFFIDSNLIHLILRKLRKQDVKD
ncbi:MAG: hypothetical protein ACI9K1_000713 [Arcticibacterium sp.]|jgi:hypothetical protein